MGGIEPVWEKLRAQLALQDGFWVGFLFCNNLLAVDELGARAQDYAQIQLKYTKVVRIDQPEELMSAMPWLLGKHPADQALAWLVGVSGEPEPWRPAWATFLRRLNERRDLLRKVIPGGLMLVSPPGLLATARESAPDLWSYRSMVDDLSAPTADTQRLDRPRVHPSPSGDYQNADLRWAVTQVLEPAAAPSDAMRPILLRTTAAVQAGQPADAVSAAQEALESARTATDTALAHAWLARALVGRDDLPAALDHARKAFALRQPLGGAYIWLTAILADSPHATEALAACEARIDIARSVIVNAGEDPTAVRYLSKSLKLAATAYRAQDQLDHALQYFTEALNIDRGINESYGESADSLDELASALFEVAEVHLALDEHDRALDCLNEAAVVARRGIERYGETSSALTRLAEILMRLADVHATTGQFDQTLKYGIEGLSVGRRRVERSDEVGAAEVLHVFARANIEIGRAYERLGQFGNALAAYEDALSTYERLRDRYEWPLVDDETWESLPTAMDRVRRRLE